MRKFVLPVRRWVLVAVWMAVIFGASADADSAQHSSRFIGPLVRWLFRGADEPTIESVIFLVRKGAHLAEYAVLSCLIFWAQLPASRRAWPRRAWITMLVVSLYAVTDEVHQLFVPTRQGTAVDVLIDTAGGFLGLILLAGCCRLVAWFRGSSAVSLERKGLRA